MDKDIIDNLYIVDDSLLLKKSIIRSPDPGLNYISTEDNSNNYSINWVHSIYDYYNPTFFVEGNNNIELELTILQSRVQEQINYSFKKELTSGIHEFFEIPVAKYKLKSGNWFKIINKYQEMIPGYINCQFSSINCELDNNSLYVKCFRSNDTLFIGKYKIADGNVAIPNLDCNTEYDIIFVDESKVLEQKVQSRRKPAPYNPVNSSLYTIIGADITEHDGTYINIKLLYDSSTINSKFGKIKVYYSNDNIDKNNLSIYPYVESDSVFDIKIPIIVSKFLVEHKSHYQTDYYNFVNSNREPRNLTHTIEYEKFRSAPIALKHKLEYDEE